MSIQRNTDERPLDTFESALLGQLTAVVDERATQAATSPARRLTSRPARWSAAVAAAAAGTAALLVLPGGATPAYAVDTCLLYTSDAADERSSGDLGGRRIIKKKNKKKKNGDTHCSSTKPAYDVQLGSV